MLLGNYSANLGEKRRVAIPKKFRGELGDRVVIAKWYEGCLVLTGKGGWEKLMDRLTKSVNFITSSVRDTDRFILGSAYELEPDSQGRVVVPEPLARFAALKNDVTFLGLGDRVEVWDRTAWEKKEQTIVKEAEELMEKISASEKVVLKT